MTDPNDTWPLPQYDPGPKDLVHALGVITIEYNKFETALFGLFRHHLEAHGLPTGLVEDFYTHLNEGHRLAVIQSIFARCEKDDLVKDRVSELIRYFNTCAENRNILMHSTSTGSHNRDVLDIAKRSKNVWSRLNYSLVKLETLKLIADDMFRGFNYMFDIFWYIQVRDGKAGGVLPALFPASLPGALPPPFKLEMFQR